MLLRPIGTRVGALASKPMAALGAAVSIGAVLSFAGPDLASAADASNPGSTQFSVNSTIGVLVSGDVRLAAAAIAPADDAATRGAPSAARAAAELPPAAVRRAVEGEIRRGDTLSVALRRHGLPRSFGPLVAREMRGHFDFRKSQPGHHFIAVVDESGELFEFRYLTSKTDGFRLRRLGNGYQVERDEATLVSRVSRISGIVDTSLYESMQSLGASPQLAQDFASIFAWDLDFSRSVRQGDGYKVLYERLYSVADDGSEAYLRPGRILAAQYDGAAGDFTAIYFEEEEGRGSYYRPDGTSVERSFLLAPMQYGRISSRYSSARRHPILKVTRPHYGIDYAASVGTPVWAVADGEVIYRARAGGFGNLVKVRHMNGYVSYYAHLSRYANGLSVSDHVHQKQLIGYVGQSGLATGPHVCFRMTHQGKYVDPMQVPRSAGRPVSPLSTHLFEGTRDILLAELGGSLLFAVDEAL
ncbi:MAG: M23 family metallopeptidase [Myxococcales bacterium]|nr:M23 family metallopeptidase [Myxococcales bacterium]